MCIFHKRVVQDNEWPLNFEREICTCKNNGRLCIYSIFGSWYWFVQVLHLLSLLFCEQHFSPLHRIFHFSAYCWLYLVVITEYQFLVVKGCPVGHAWSVSLQMTLSWGCSLNKQATWQCNLETLYLALCTDKAITQSLLFPLIEWLQEQWLSELSDRWTLASRPLEGLHAGVK